MTDREALEFVMKNLKDIPRFETYYDEEFGEDKQYCYDGLYVDHYEIEEIEKIIERHLNNS